LFELRAFDLDRENAGEIRRVFQPIGLHLKLRGVADGLAGGGVRNGLHDQRRETAAGHRDELETRCGDAHEIFRMAVEHVGRELAGGLVAEEFEVVSVFADFDQRATVGAVWTCLAWAE
jgi:hypothetical protein